MIKLQSDDAASRDSVGKAAERSLMAKMLCKRRKAIWLAGVIMKGYGFGLIGNIVVGIVGAFIAGLVLPKVGVAIGGGILGSIIHATIGAVILLFIVGLVRRA